MSSFLWTRLWNLISMKWTEDEKVGFTYIWTIENFSYGIQGDSGIISPVIDVGTLEKTQWELRMYPGKDRAVDLDLKRLKDIDKSKNDRVDVGFELSILENNGSHFVRNKVDNLKFFPEKTWTCSYFFKRDEMLGARSIAFLPHDTLTVRLRMWIDSVKAPKISFGRTRFGVERKSFTWAINDFSSLCPQQRSFLQVATTSKEIEFLNFELFLDGEKIEIDITAAECNHFTPQTCGILLTCKISLLDVTGNVVESVDASDTFHFSVRKQNWRFPSFLTKDKLMDNKFRQLPNDTLLLRCEYTSVNRITANDIKYIPFLKNNSQIHKTRNITNSKSKKTETETEINADNKSSNFFCDFQSLFEEGMFCDYEVQVQSKTFPVHKSVLSARSPVFRAMFANEIKEKRIHSKCISVPDVDAYTMHKMLLFMYSDAVGDLEWESAIKLYVASDKYGILSLKKICRSFLLSGIRVSNVTQMLAIANVQHDQTLRWNVLDFISHHADEIIGTEQWTVFEKNHLQLSVDTLRELYLWKTKY